MIPGIGPDWKSSAAEDLGGGAVKYIAFKFFEGAGANWGGTAIGVIGKTVSGTIEGVADIVGLPLMGAAINVQVDQHIACAIAAAF